MASPGPPRRKNVAIADSRPGSSPIRRVEGWRRQHGSPRVARVQAGALARCTFVASVADPPANFPPNLRDSRRPAPRVQSSQMYVSGTREEETEVMDAAACLSPLAANHRPSCQDTLRGPN